MTPIVLRPIKKLLKSFSKKIFLVKVEGFSLFPDLIPGKVYLALSFIKIKKGDFVIFKYGDKFYVKKVLDFSKDKIYLLDNLSRKHLINRHQVIAKIVLRNFSL